MCMVIPSGKFLLCMCVSQCVCVCIVYMYIYSLASHCISTSKKVFIENDQSHDASVTVTVRDNLL